MEFFYLQQYEDGTYGYAGIDNLENEHGKVISEQDVFEKREDYINRCGLTFAKGQYGSNLKLDIQTKDEDYVVRRDLADQGYGLEKLINDDDFRVRLAVADQGYGLEQLVNDKSYNVRIAVAKQGYGLEKLVNDEEDYVREAVAEQGYGLEQLVNDECEWVRVATRYATVVKFEKEDIMLKGDANYDCYSYIRYFIDKNNPKAIAKILISQINNNWPCNGSVYKLVKKYAKDNNIQPLFKILDSYYEHCYSYYEEHC